MDPSGYPPTPAIGRGSACQEQRYFNIHTLHPFMAKTYHNLSPTALGSQFSWCFLALRPFFLGHRSSQDSTTSAMMHRTAPVPCAAETPGGAPRDRR